MCGGGAEGAVRHFSINADTDRKLRRSDGHECEEIYIHSSSRGRADHRLHTNFHLHLQAGVQEAQTRAGSFLSRACQWGARALGSQSSPFLGSARLLSPRRSGF